MPSCQALKQDGTRCGIASNNFFWFHDSDRVINKTFDLCQVHSDMILSRLLYKERTILGILDMIKNKLRNLRSRMRTEKNFNDKIELNELYNKQKTFYEQLNIARNKTCRLCNYPLTDPANPRYQTTKNYTVADFKTERGYRRADCLFHTKCGRIWISSCIALDSKVLAWITPLTTGQTVLIND